MWILSVLAVLLVSLALIRNWPLIEPHLPDRDRRIAYRSRLRGRIARLRGRSKRLVEHFLGLVKRLRPPTEVRQRMRMPDLAKLRGHVPDAAKLRARIPRRARIVAIAHKPVRLAAGLVPIRRRLNRSKPQAPARAAVVSTRSPAAIKATPLVATAAVSAAANGPRRAIGYAVGCNGQEFDGQQRAMERICNERGWKLAALVKEPVGRYSGPGGRAGLTHVLRQVGSGSVAQLIVGRLHSIARSPEELAAILEWCGRHHVGLVALDVGLDTTTPDGRLAARRLESVGARAGANQRGLHNGGGDAPGDSGANANGYANGNGHANGGGHANGDNHANGDGVANGDGLANGDGHANGVGHASANGHADGDNHANGVGVTSGDGLANPDGRPGPPFKTLGYASVQHDKKDATGELDAQRRVIERKCRECNFNLVEFGREREPKDGKALERPSLSYLLGRIAIGEAGCLVVTGLDRLSRSIVELSSLLRWFDQNGVRLVVVELDLDTATPDGLTTVRSLASLGRWERERQSERTRTGRGGVRAKRRAARDSGGPDRAGLRRRIAEMRASGMTLQAIADVLNDAGVPTQRGGVKWRPSRVQTAARYKRRARTVVDDLPSNGHLNGRNPAVDRQNGSTTNGHTDNGGAHPTSGAG